MPAPVVPALPPEADPPEPVVVTEPLRVLHLETLGTREPVDITPFDAAGEVVPDEMMKLSTLLAPRNPRGGPPDPEDVVRIDPALAALLLRISAELGDAPLVIVSGHRKPGRGTSKKSFHVKGMAADIAVAGVKPVEIRRAALRAGAGGVGLYPRFVHVDVREEPYRWGAGGGRPRLRRPAPSK
ncbi:MAG: DUF882 domain-containing protein [Polyangiaceae bacterium]|nr:DUF882 domain-containing protein [Polyangiaceae bacterium]